MDNFKFQIIVLNASMDSNLTDNSDFQAFIKKTYFKEDKEFVYSSCNLEQISSILRQKINQNQTSIEESPTNFDFNRDYNFNVTRFIEDLKYDDYSDYSDYSDYDE
ncbi:MAG: hypothetical protein L6V95_06525 [Candidatus Melainabacteria bacterium]|nr:MAG: hypothetical protein L6V95_06525 [Candidatus Melainabacteria bacterium]